MKTPLLPSAICAAVLLGLAAFAQAQLTQISDFKIRVEVKAKTDAQKNSKTQNRTLRIFVSSSSRESAELVAKYAFIARSVKGNDVKKFDEGEKAVSVGPLATVEVDSDTASATMQDAHSEKGGKGKSGKKVEASGDKLIGYGVQLFQGEKLVAEYYDPPSAKEAWLGAK